MQKQARYLVLRLGQIPGYDECLKEATMFRSKRSILMAVVAITFVFTVSYAGGCSGGGPTAPPFEEPPPPPVAQETSADLDRSSFVQHCGSSVSSFGGITVKGMASNAESKSIDASVAFFDASRKPMGAGNNNAGRIPPGKVAQVSTEKLFSQDGTSRFIRLELWYTDGSGKVLDEAGNHVYDEEVCTITWTGT